MRIYWKLAGGHVHCRVFTIGSKCGDLTFTEGEWFQWVHAALSKIAELRPESDQ
jgi:hypothetical protein